MSEAASSLAGAQRRPATNSPLVSIVIPCFNQAQFLAEAVNSALAQTYEDIEIIVVDDGSSEPESQAILSTFHALKTQVIRQENKGVQAARNTGIRKARGLYILPLDADDIIEPGYLAAAVPVLEQSDSIGIVTCNARFFGAANKFWKLPECSLENMLRENCIHITSLFRKSDWEAVGGFDESLRHAYEDYDFWLSLFSLGKKAHRLDEVLFHYRKHEGSVNATWDMATKHEALACIFAKHIDLYRSCSRLSAQCIYTVLQPVRPRHMEIKKNAYQVERTVLNALFALPGMARLCGKRLNRIERKLAHIARVEEWEKR